MNRTRDIAAGLPGAVPRPGPPKDPRTRVDAELRAFHAALVALPVPERFVRIVRDATPIPPCAATPLDREDRR